MKFMQMKSDKLITKFAKLKESSATTVQMTVPGLS